MPPDASSSDNNGFPMSECMEEFAEAVRRTAYFLWEQDGRPEGRADEYWLRALDQHARARVNDGALRNNAPRDANTSGREPGEAAE